MSDLHTLTTMARYFWQESPYTAFRFAPDKIMALLRNAIDDPDFLVAVATVEDKPVGMLVGQLMAPTFSHDTVAVEVAWYLRPEHRKSRLAMALSLAYNEWAKNNGAKAINYSMLSTSPTSVKEIYTRMGHKPVEITYQKVL